MAFTYPEGLDEYESEVEAEVLSELLALDPVHQRLRLVCFVSSSKGRGRNRTHPIEVRLILNVLSGACTIWNKFQFDVVATEILPNSRPDEAEAELKRRIGGE